MIENNTDWGADYPQGITPKNPTRKQVSPLKALESGVDFIIRENRAIEVGDDIIDMLIDGWIKGEQALARNYVREFANSRLLKK